MSCIIQYHDDAISKFFIMEYTIILVYEWSKYGEKIKEFFHNNKLKWNSEKVKNLSNEELKNEYEKFKVDKDFIIDVNMIGSYGIYENNDKSITIKIIKIENVDNMLIVYKGIEQRFYIDLIKRCRDIGCLVMKIVDNEVIFKSRINVKLIKLLNDVQGEKDVKIRNFIEKTKILDSEFHELFSDDFKKQWIECINN